MAETIGEQLRRARQTRHLTLEQAAQATRIRLHYLEALENDQRDLLPSSVQGKGFLRLYAGFLSLPAQPLIDQWDGRSEQPAAIALPAAQVATATPPPTPPVEPSPEDALALPASPAPETPPAPPPDAAPQPLPPTPPANEPAQSSQALFDEIGQQLRTRREALNLSLTDVEHHTRLRRHYLEAIESGRMNDLPSLVQGRGMLSNYARFLDVDSDAILLKFADALQNRRLERMPAQPTTPLPRRSASTVPAHIPLWRRLLNPDLLVVSAIIIVLVGFVILTIPEINAYNASSRSLATAPAIADVLVSTQEDFGPPTPTITLPPTPTRSTAQPDQPSGEEMPTETLAPEQSASLDPTQLSVSPLQLNVIARQRSWMRVTVDGKVAFIGRVAPGNAYDFSGSKQIEFTTGNGAGVQLIYNQRDLGTLGLVGQVISLNFTLSGMQTPTLAFTATPTITPTPTATQKASPTGSTNPTSTVTPFIPQ